MRAVVITQHPEQPTLGVEEVDPSLLEGEVLIAVEYTGVNFKDSMTLARGNRVARLSPLIGGVDLAGTVIESSDPGVAVGSTVIAHGHGVGTSHHGGFAELARIPSEWVTPLPAELDARSAMVLGTAGFTAMASLAALEAAGLRPSDGELLVTGAAGGVGSTAVALAAASGFDVVGSSGRPSEADYLHRIGCSSVIGRDDIDPTPTRSLSIERWSGAIDCVGGSTLAGVLRTLHYGAAVAASGLTGGTELTTSVFPFIVRGVKLLGIDSVEMPTPQRSEIWRQLGRRFPLANIEEILEREVGLDEVPEVLRSIASGQVRGRIIVDPRR